MEDREQGATMEADKRPTYMNNTQSSMRKARPPNQLFHLRSKSSINDDFFTDSIMSDRSSNMPSPSSTRTGSVHGSATKPRRVNGHSNSKSLSAAYEITEKRERNGSRASDIPTLRNMWSQSGTMRRRSPPPQRPEIDVNTAATPTTPGRPRQAHDLTSPDSTASSPPKGLDETYRRIADEEDLTGQEGEFEDEDYGDDDFNFASPNEEDRARLDRLLLAGSPSSLRHSRRASPQPSGGNNINQDDTAVSQVSGMSFFDEMTDQDLAAKLTPGVVSRAKDKARMDRAISRESPILFARKTKGRPGNDRYLPEASEDLTKGTNASVESLRSDKLDRSLNVPKTWGSKGKVGKEWLNKIHRGENAETKDSTMVDWAAAAADVPLPPNGDAQSNAASSSRNSTPVSMNHKSSLDRLRQWELNDFTGTSLQVSNSPPVRARNATLEIENLERRAVTTNRLDELRKKESIEQLGRQTPTGDSFAKVKLEDPKSIKSVKFEDYGEAIPNTPIVVYKQGANGLSRSVSDSVAKRPELDRHHDSIDDLQLLSRAISESPGPRLPEEDESIALRDFLWRRNDDTGIQRVDTRTAEATPLPPRLNALDLAVKTPLVTGAWVDTILPDTVKTNRKTPGTAILPKTPHILGGWIDTPAPTIKKEAVSSEMPEHLVNGIVETKSKPSSELSAPAVKKQTADGPSSALAHFLAKAKAKTSGSADSTQQLNPTDDKTVDIGNLTMESLEDILTLDNADMTTLIRMSAELDARRAISSAIDIDSPSAEDEVVERLAAKLERLQNSIHTARKGISKLEKSVSSSADNKQLTLQNLGELSEEPCPSCGCSGAHNHTTTIAVTLPFNAAYLRLFYPRTKPRQFSNPLTYFPCPTPLGFLIFGVWGYYLLESALCIQYCHPMYADFYVWPEEPEPRFGAVIPTLIWRKTGLRWLVRLLSGSSGSLQGMVQMIWWFGIAMIRFILNATGFSDGFVGEGDSGYNYTMASGSASTGAGAAIPTGEGDSMAFDEYL